MTDKFNMTVGQLHMIEPKTLFRIYKYIPNCDGEKIFVQQSLEEEIPEEILNMKIVYLGRKIFTMRTLTVKED